MKSLSLPRALFFSLVLCALPHLDFPASVNAQPTFPVFGTTGPTASNQLEITAERVEFDRKREVYKARGSVLVVQGFLRLTSDQITLHKLSGRLIAEGRVHLNDQVSDVWADRLEINVNTESGMIMNGRIFLKETNTWVRGRLLERVSETHYRAKDGSFTTCNADDGQIPDWSFSFEDVDLEQNDSVYAKSVWFRVKDHPIFPLPTFRYPMPGARKTGFLVPTIGIDNEFGFKYRQGFFWAFSPTQDLTLTPQILSDRGGGGDVKYRYILNRQSRGNWLVRSIYDTEEDQARAEITGAHVQRLTSGLSFRVKVNYATDRTTLLDLSNSGVSRALLSQESLLTLTQRLNHGSAHLKAQYLQPLSAGGPTTFQRLPEIGHHLTPQPLAGGLVVGMDSTFVHFFREEGFGVSRVDLVPSMAMQGLHVGHVVGFRPEVKLLGGIYSRGKEASQDNMRDRGTFWVGLEAASNLSRRFPLGEASGLHHTIQPKVIYEYVPQTKQSDLVQIDAVDNLPKKHLLTYSLNSRLMEEGSRKDTTTWLNLMLAQSYHLGTTPGQASVFSDIWAQASLKAPDRFLASPLSQLSLTTDSFYDPGDGEFSQFNADVRVQAQKNAYVQVGYRHTQAGPIPRRGDIWNSISLNEVLAPQAKIDFLTAGGGIRTPWGWTVGGKVYHDFATGQTPEWDVVGLYQNPCRCWSLGLYYVQLAGAGGVSERNQFNFLLTLRGIGATPGFGTKVVKAILGPLLEGEPGLPWSPR